MALANLTHPTWGSNFAVGDMFQVSISNGLPYAPVSVAGSSSGSVSLGTTDAFGNFTYTAAEQTSNIGSYGSLVGWRICCFAGNFFPCGSVGQSWHDYFDIDGNNPGRQHHGCFKALDFQWGSQHIFGHGI